MKKYLLKEQGYFHRKTTGNVAANVTPNVGNQLPFMPKDRWNLNEITTFYAKDNTCKAVLKK